MYYGQIIFLCCKSLCDIVYHQERGIIHPSQHIIRVSLSRFMLYVIVKDLGNLAHEISGVQHLSLMDVFTQGKSLLTQVAPLPFVFHVLHPHFICIMWLPQRGCTRVKPRRPSLMYPLVIAWGHHMVVGRQSQERITKPFPNPQHNFICDILTP